jgi:flagellar protein FlaG
MVSDINNRLAVNPQASPPQAAPAASGASEGVKKQPSPVAHGEAKETKTETHFNKDEILKAVEDINKHAQVVSRDLQFSIDESSGRTIVQVIDSETDEIVRQIPAEEFLAIAERLRETNDFNSTGFFEEA